MSVHGASSLGRAITNVGTFSGINGILKLLFSDVGPCVVKPGSAAIPAVWSFVQRKVFPGVYFCLPVSKFCLSVQSQSARGAGVYVRRMSEKPAPDGVVPPIKACACGPFGSPGGGRGRLSGPLAQACRCRILILFLLGTTT